MESVYKQFAEWFQATQNWFLIGVIILAGSLGSKIVRTLCLPSVVGYLIIGILFGALSFILKPSHKYHSGLFPPGKIYTLSWREIFMG